MKTIITSKTYLLWDALRTKRRLHTNLVVITTILNLNNIFNLTYRNGEVNEFQYVFKSTPTWVYGMKSKIHNKIENLLAKLDVSPQVEITHT